MILLVCKGEYVYDGCLEGLYVCQWAEISLYVDLYEDVDLVEGHEADFCVECPGVWYKIIGKNRLFCIFELYRAI